MLDPEEQRITGVFHNRKKLGLSPLDLAVLLYFVSLSNRRILITESQAFLSENLGINLSQLQRCMLQLRCMNYIHKTTYRKQTGIIVNPAFVGCGDLRRKQVKAELWAEAQHAFTVERKAIHDKRLEAMKQV